MDRETMGNLTVSTHGVASRRAVLLGIGATLATPALARARVPNTRALSLHNTRTGDRFDDVYYADGQYEPEAMDALDRLLRDHTADEVTIMDVRLYDLFAGLQTTLDKTDPLRITSGYRTRATNEALRKRTRWAAKNSLHIEGMAADFKLPGTSGRTLARAAKSLKMGGVGTYGGASFIHVDVGDVRAWHR
jgi:uncharacterized protein YcbK (DUF882 family)